MSIIDYEEVLLGRKVSAEQVTFHPGFIAMAIAILTHKAFRDGISQANLVNDLTVFLADATQLGNVHKNLMRLAEAAISMRITATTVSDLSEDQFHQLLMEAGFDVDHEMAWYAYCTKIVVQRRNQDEFDRDFSTILIDAIRLLVFDQSYPATNIPQLVQLVAAPVEGSRFLVREILGMVGEFMYGYGLNCNREVIDYINNSVVGVSIRPGNILVTPKGSIAFGLYYRIK